MKLKIKSVNNEPKEGVRKLKLEEKKCKDDVKELKVELKEKERGKGKGKRQGEEDNGFG